MGHMAAARTLYDILSISQDAAADAVRKAYKRKVLQTHPDKLSPRATDAQKHVAEARFREVCTAFEILSDPAKRQVYDNGLNYMRTRTSMEEAQAKLTRDRQEWARQAEVRQQERAKNMKAGLQASEARYQENLMKAEMRYREKMRALEEQIRISREKLQKSRYAARAPDQTASESFASAEEMLKELRRLNPEWEIRRQEVLRRQTERMKR